MWEFLFGLSEAVTWEFLFGLSVVVLCVLCVCVLCVYFALEIWSLVVVVNRAGKAVMRKILFWLTVWFVVLCVCFALHGWSLVVVVNRAGIEVTEIDFVWFNPQWDGRGDDSFVKYNFWKSVIWFFGLWLGIPLLLAYGWTADERAETWWEKWNEKRWKKLKKTQKRMEDYAEALRRHQERRQDGRSEDV